MSKLAGILFVTGLVFASGVDKINGDINLISFGISMGCFAGAYILHKANESRKAARRARRKNRKIS